MDGDYNQAKHTYIYNTVEKLSVFGINKRYQLSDEAISILISNPDPFDDDAYRKSVFNSAYSRKTKTVHLHKRPPRESKFVDFSEDKNNTERKETWIDVCARVIEGLFTFYADHLRRNMLPIPENIDEMACNAVSSMARMIWLPPGRGLFAMGTEHTYKNGNAALNNCYAVSTKEAGLVKSAVWTMDMLMCGGGVGFSVDWAGEVISADKENNFNFTIPDTRQGWVCSLELLLRAYIPINGQLEKFPIFDFSKLRPYGEPIHGFGGTSSGSEPLRVLLKRTEIFLDTHLEWISGKHDVDIYSKLFNSLHEHDVYSTSAYDNEVVLNEVIDSCKDNSKPYNSTRLIMDIFNSIGACVVAGNVRRSAQIALGDPEDLTFIDMKDWMKCPERRPWMHLSNNTIRLWKNEDFTKILPNVAKRIRTNGEPGVVNMINLQRYGRFGDTKYRPDKATLLNPCAEIALESFEPCCLSTIVPYNCIVEGVIDWKLLDESCKWATFYATVVSTIRHHWSETNRIVSRNRRIGVSYTGIADVREEIGPIGLNDTFRKSYYIIRNYNTTFTGDLGIPESIRVTTVKPEGTISIIAGTSAGVHYPICRFGKRRVAFDKSSLVAKALIDANYPYEDSTLTANQVYVIFPIKSKSSRTTRNVSIFEKMGLAVSAQKHYSDNSVSFTGDFKPSTEGELVENVLADYIAQTKVISMLPQFEGSTNQYKHLPFEEITEKEYEDIRSHVSTVDWSSVFNLQQEDADKSSTLYCTGDNCIVNI